MVGTNSGKVAMSLFGVEDGHTTVEDSVDGMVSMVR